ncbi:TPA: hypothetical protein DDW69_00880 [candidate division CPR2 bacterium]|uniref:Glycosyltransferase n=1 Tax=candidate division CPR2 bacterium GW2011_GWC1_41_48 TaxID=1618344 RepID=A0A0G0WC42_UNCC2|nr:MAG: Glycosyltransferase [candidate division CPR2 bacterium GW2011_GWC2_39_35]KKR27838.1 MAG: Glycosyltransferase [candidate division CPR2 bacterium GW2011_GWD1_39_7]KKR28736.1 MAG: Glycosyltransferase [candidate division CPR2 bacterium GW2011_GWD2_39_7]KKS09607.1 MAG: Glycosyltransferase [candidate division CPR2 bacterium GW2011_GWC1_41_48]OGB59963.1 MAG: hypothetical protein A2Y27_00250 [candidate division CPR2 bacterium GWD1_39_7]OGB73127.1 MAG: hypothetical protein A2Y26_03050 [candidat
MKIVHIFHYPGQGGSEQYAYLLSKYAIKDGNSVEFIFGSEGPFVARAEELGCKIHFVDMKSIYDVGAIINLVRMFKKIRPDVVHTHHLRENFLSIIAAKFSPVKAVISTMHWIEPKSRFKAFAEHIYSLGLDKFIAVSELAKDYLQSEGISKKKIEVIYNGIEVGPVNKEAILKEIGLTKYDKIIVNVSRFTAEKGQKTLIEAFSKVTDDKARLVLVGAGELLENSKKLAESLFVKDKIIFVGGRNNGYEIMSIADVYVQPSEMEAFGLSVIEAMMQGIPVIASIIKAHEIVLDHGKFGTLYSSEDADDLAQKLNEALNNPKIAIEKAMKAKEYAFRNYTAEKMWKNTNSLYIKLSKKG